MPSSRFPNLTDSRYCEQHKQHDRPSAAKRGYNSKWQRISKQSLRKHPLCVKCRADGKFVTAADTESLNFRKAFVNARFHLAGCCIWVKDSLVLRRSDYQWQHAPVLYGFMQNGKHKWYADRKQTTIWNFDNPKRNANHPTSKPLDLLSYPIGNSTQENGVVIDTFGGSGSTTMACEQMNRICCMMELDEKNASVILLRYRRCEECVGYPERQKDDVF